MVPHSGAAPADGLGADVLRGCRLSQGRRSVECRCISSVSPSSQSHQDPVIVLCPEYFHNPVPPQRSQLQTPSLPLDYVTTLFTELQQELHREQALSDI